MKKEPDDTEKAESDEEKAAPETNEKSKESEANGNSKRAESILATIKNYKEVPDNDDEGTAR